MFDVVIVFAGGCVHVGGQGAGLEDGEHGLNFVSATNSHKALKNVVMICC